jgi:hypothetical protein
MGIAGAVILAPGRDAMKRWFPFRSARFMLMQYHQGQATPLGLAALLHSVDVSISKRKIQRLLTDEQVSVTVADETTRNDSGRAEARRGRGWRLRRTRCVEAVGFIPQRPCQRSAHKAAPLTLQGHPLALNRQILQPPVMQAVARLRALAAVWAPLISFADCRDQPATIDLLDAGDAHVGPEGPMTHPFHVTKIVGDRRRSTRLYGECHRPGGDTQPSACTANDEDPHFAGLVA